MKFIKYALQRLHECSKEAADALQFADEVCGGVYELTRQAVDEGGVVGEGEDDDPLAMCHPNVCPKVDDLLVSVRTLIAVSYGGGPMVMLLTKTCVRARLFARWMLCHLRHRAERVTLATALYPEQADRVGVVQVDGDLPA